MAINFPSSPTLNQTYTYNSKAWKWNGVAWDLTSTGNGLVIDSTANTNYVVVAGAAADSEPRIYSDGEDTNIGLDFSTKGSDPLRFYTNDYASLQLLIEHLASASNYLKMRGSTGENSVEIEAAGSGDNIGVNIVTKGDGTFTVNGEPVQGVGGGGAFTASDTAPTDPSVGDGWLNTDTGVLYFWYEDDDSGQWVDLSNNDIAGGSGDGTVSNTFSIGDGLAGTKKIQLENANGTMAVQSNHTASRTLTLPDDTATLSTQKNLGVRNKIINGKMEIAQRGTSFTSAADGQYTVDRWALKKSGAAAFTCSRSTSAPSNEFQNSLSATCTTSDATIGASDLYALVQNIEGYLVRDLIGRTFTLSFWVNAPTVGTYCVAFSNNSDKSYVAEYEVSLAGAWEYKTITVSSGLPATGTWNWTTGLGLQVSFALAGGSDWATTAGAWQSNNYRVTANQVNAVTATSTSFLITGVQLELGAVPTHFEHRPYGMELSLCQRYFEKSYGPEITPGTAANVAGAHHSVCATVYILSSGSVNFATMKRAVPTIAFYAPGDGTSNAGTEYNSGSTALGARGLVASTTGQSGFEAQANGFATAGNFIRFHWTANAEL